MTDLDPNSVAAAVSVQLARDFIDQIRSNTFGALAKKVLPHLKNFSPYLERTHYRCSNIRILTNRDSIYNLEDIYVGGRYRQAEKVIDEFEVCQRLRDKGRLVVLGFGGIGKTILMKRLWLSLFSEPQGRIPVFVELRRLNDLKTPSLQSYIKHTLAGPHQEFSDADFHELLLAGKFVFLIDGFDELYDHIRDQVQAEIGNISFNYPAISIILSSRRDERFYSLERFQVLEAVPFDQEQTLSLIRKVEFDALIKKKFISEIVEKQFDKYESFLSTPLLSLIMLLTFRQFAEITPKLHIFYKHAFQTLYSLHDASKEAFSRERRSGLDEDQFEKVFSLFCLASYMELDFSFTDEKIKAYLDRAKKRADISVSSKKFIEEAIESVNLLHRDGDVTVFTHRSFQEYFAAKAAVSYFPGNVRRLVDRLPNRPGDGVLSLAYEINPDVIEEEYVIPEFGDIGAEITRLFYEDQDHMARMRALGASLMVDISEPAAWVIFFAGRHMSFCAKVSRFYGGRYYGFGYGPARRPGSIPKMDAVIRKAVKGVQGMHELSPQGILVFNFSTETAAFDKFDEDGEVELVGAFNALPVSDKRFNSALGAVMQQLVSDNEFLRPAMAQVRKRQAARASEISDLL